MRELCLAGRRTIKKGRTGYCCKRIVQRRFQSAFVRRVRTLPEAKKGYMRIACSPSMSLVGRTGFEPVTNGLKVRCSTS
jgi:hypothetical protein